MDFLSRGSAAFGASFGVLFGKIDEMNNFIEKNMGRHFSFLRSVNTRE
jgi:hypothetical protein